MNLTVAIPTYGRESVLIDTITSLLKLKVQPLEILIIDQSQNHQPETTIRLQQYNKANLIKWIRLAKPSITKAMNVALNEASAERILFLDDDIIPDVNLVASHLDAGKKCPDALVAGRVLQPWHNGNPDPPDSDFLFNSIEARSVDEFMGGNFSVSKVQAIAIGGFDENFVRVAYRFEAEFASRWRKAGYAILYEPHAIIHHLKATAGGTRKFGQHLTTLQPYHSVGRYYFLLRTKSLPSAIILCLRDFILSVKSRHHILHPWWIPLTLFAEAGGLVWSICLFLQGPSYIKSKIPKVLILGSHPIQYQVPLLKALESDPTVDSEVLYITLPQPETQGLGFGVPFTWDIPILEGYKWRQAKSTKGQGITHGYFGLWLTKPWNEIVFGPSSIAPDIIFLTGWHFFGLVQLYLAALLRRIPILLRIETNDLGPKPLLLRIWHSLLLIGVGHCLAIGKANKRYLSSKGVSVDKITVSPYHIDNNSFEAQASNLRQKREEIREYLEIDQQSFCFLFVGKLQDKKRPLDILKALIFIKKHLPPVHIHLLVVGTGSLQSKCKEVAHQHRLNVSFSGFLNQSQIVKAYVASDCLVLPSDFGETWGLVVNEAMACGLPAIVSNHAGCMEDLIIQNETGIAYPCGDIPALATAMHELASNPQKSIIMGKKAHQHLRMYYSLERAKQGLLCSLSVLQSNQH